MSVQDPQACVLNPKRRWRRCTVPATLLTAVTAAIACYCYFDHRHLAKARDDYAYATAQYETDLIRITDLCTASRRLAEAEQQSYIVGTLRARAGHLLRVGELELKYQAFIRVATFAEGGREEAYKTLDEVVQCRIKAQEWLKEAIGD